MEAYHTEVICPPLVLVALLGRADLHPAVGEALQKPPDHRHQINYIGIPDARGAARLFGAPHAFMYPYLSCKPSCNLSHS